MIKITERLSAVLFAALLMLCTPLCVFAESSQKLIDDAGLFTAEEASALEAQLRELSDATDWDIIIYTNYNDIDSEEMEYYYNDYYDMQGFGRGDSGSGVMFTVDMGSQRRLITTKGDAMYYFSDERVDDLKSDIISEIYSGDYYAAAEVFINTVSDYYAQGKPEDGEFSNVRLNEKTENPALYIIKYYGIMIAAVSLAIAVVAVLGVRSRYKNNGKKNTYDLHANSAAVLTDRQDILVNKRVIVTRIQSDNGPHGGGGHSHGRGGSHGGGGSF